MQQVNYRPRHVAPTLVEAVGQLTEKKDRGFVFVRPDGSERFCSFSEIHAEAARRGAHLAAKGMHKGDRLAIVIPDGDEFVLSFLGAIFAGVVPVPIYPQLSFKNVAAYHETVAHIVRASGAKMLLTTPATRPFVEPVLAKVETLTAILTTDDLASRSAAGDALQEPDALDFGKLAIAPNDLAFLQFTSGSTSRPKGVMVTHGNLAANAEAFMIHGLRKDSVLDKGVSWLPLFHDMGLIGFVIGPLFADIPIVFLPTSSFVRAPRLWLETIHKHRATMTYAPNFAYALVAKRVKEKDVAGLDLSCVRVAGCGAEPIQARTLREFARKLGPAKFNARAFLPSYGMAEATLAITFVEHQAGMKSDLVDPKMLQSGKAIPRDPATTEHAISHEIVCCGKSFPEHEIAIVDDDGNELGEREVGQIISRGPSISPGYYDEPELTAAAFKPGPPSRGEGHWLHTGDLGYIANREIFVCGRLKDIIIVRGRNFYPQDIEWAVSELEGVRRGNVVAFGVDVDGEEQLVVCAEAFQSDAEGLSEKILACVAAEIGLSVHKVAIVAQGGLPRTSSGKPQRRKTKEMFTNGTLPTGRARDVQDGPAMDETPTIP
jgi:fatty-acyl-CoA synthase